MSLVTRARLARWVQQEQREKDRQASIRADLAARCQYVNEILRTKIKVDDLRYVVEDDRYFVPRDPVYVTVDGIEFAITRRHEGYDNLGGGMFCHLWLRQHYDERKAWSEYEITSLPDLATMLDRAAPSRSGEPTE